MKAGEKARRPWEKHLREVRSWGLSWKSAVFGGVLLCLAGCGERQPAVDSGLKDEVAKLRQEVDRLKDMVRDMRRRTDVAERNMQRKREMFQSLLSAGTNGPVRVQGQGRPQPPSREKMEARRKMMQDPEMRKKLEAERKARAEERRRRHEERRREMEERRQSRPSEQAPLAAPAGQAR